MRCPTLTQLPPPPSDKTGWPWTQESSHLPDTFPDPAVPFQAGDISWPRISIVTPSYNQAQFLEETIRSVLLQGYPDLEYIIIDGGSTDGSVEIIEKYEPWLAYWVSERDQGQSHAINKGFERTTGEILAWLNSDDVYLSNVFGCIAPYFGVNPNVGLVYGNCCEIDENSQIVKVLTSQQLSVETLLTGLRLAQPASFMRGSVLRNVGLLREDLHYIMDYDCWLRIAQNNSDLRYLNDTWANLRMWDGCKSEAQEFAMANEQYMYLSKLSQEPTSHQWSSNYWNDGLACAAIWMARAALLAGKYERITHLIGKAIEHSPSWVQEREKSIGAELAKSAIMVWGTDATATCSPMLNELFHQGHVARRLSTEWEAWLHARTADTCFQRGQRLDALRHMVRAIWERPHLLRDPYYGRLFVKTIFPLSFRFRV